MKQFKKILSLILISALITISLCACGFDIKSVKGPIYLVKDHILYNNDGTVFTKQDYEYDEKGNMIKYITYIKNPYKGETNNDVTYSDFDEYGYHSTATGIGNQPTTKYENTIKDGLLLKSIDNCPGDEGSSLEYTYYNDGKTKSMILTYNDGMKITSEYDKTGLLKKYTIEGTNVSPTTKEYNWELDDKDNVKGSTINTTKDGKTVTKKQTYECDVNGNIISSYEDGKLLDKYEYIKIDNPSVAAWIQSFKKCF